MASKKVKISFSRRAERDILEIYRYLSEHSESALVAVDRKLFDAFCRLEQFPDLGHWVKEFAGKKYREVLIYHYRVIYRYLEKVKKIQILTIRHGKRYLPVGF